MISSFFFVSQLANTDEIVLEPAPRQGGGKVEDVDGLIGKLKELGAL